MANNEERSIPKIGGLYRHFKNNEYRIIAIAKDSETGEDNVVYQAQYGEGLTYVRKLDEFMSKVDKNKYPDSNQEYRFEEIEMVNADLMDFLDADSFEKKVEVLSLMHDRITNELINSMAASFDVMIEDDDNIENRYDSLMFCLQTRARFECNRLR